MRAAGFIVMCCLGVIVAKGQLPNCELNPARVKIDFGQGIITDPNSSSLSAYRRVGHPCPSDGHYSFVSSTSLCFNGDWHTLSEDHTPGDRDGNMLLVNAAPRGGVFLRIPVKGLKANTRYELGMWLLNLCRPTRKCPTVLLPNLKIQMQTDDGTVIANIVTRDLPRVEKPYWTQHRVLLNTPENSTNLQLVMMDNAPGGCGNDFALDDISFRECVPPEPPTSKTTSTKPPVSKSTPKKRPSSKPAAKTSTAAKKTEPKESKKASVSAPVVTVKKPVIKFPPPPPILRSRENALVKTIEVPAGEILVELYDNGTIDGDTVSIYHNNRLIKSKQRLSQQPVSITLEINPSAPQHELIMVAENLGSIPPNTSVMIINTPNERHRVSITSSEQKNARVVFTLKE